MANDLPSTTVGWIAIAAGAVGVLAMVFLGLFFAVGEPFGTLNDLLSGVLAVASAALAWSLCAAHRDRSPLASQIGLVLALAGAAMTVVGSALVISRTTGWVLAGFYSTVGYALIGGWLALFCFAYLHEGTFPQRLMTLGLVTGILMAFGLINIMGIAAKIDSIAAMPWYLSVAYVGNLGSLLYLVWAIWLGRFLLSR